MAVFMSTEDTVTPFFNNNVLHLIAFISDYFI